jgi:peroxiredoxin
MRFAVVAIALFACKGSSEKPAADKPPVVATTPDHAEVGKLAPDFTLSDLDGKPVNLHDYRGKTVVLEWFNPECPFVRMSHTKGSLVDTAQKRTAQGIVWLAINSAAEGKQGYGVEKNKAGLAKFNLTHPVLLDPNGKVGHTYGATNTPHMFVIDAQGKLVYKGAIDNSPDGEGESPADGKLVSYVDVALDAIAQNKEPVVKETKAYGCSVKY